MTIYAELLRFIDINRNCIFKVDLKKKSIRNGGSYFIKNGEYNPNKDLITLDCQFKTQKEATLYCLEVIENLYRNYKYSNPSKETESFRDKSYFKALPEEELT